MFLLYTNDIGDKFESQIRLFANDTILYTVIKGMGDAALLQNDLEKTIDWSNPWQISFSRDKCKVLRIYRSLHPVVHQYILDGTVVESVHHHPYLDIELTSNPNWGKHISNIVGKAKRTLGFFRRNRGKYPESVKNQAYTTLIRPRLEYCSSVWDPHTHKHAKDIEGIQRRAARFVKGCYVRIPGTVTRLLKEHKCSTLQQRRQISRLMMMYKIINDQSCPVQITDYVQKKIRVTDSSIVGTELPLFLRWNLIIVRWNKLSLG